MPCMPKRGILKDLCITETYLTYIMHNDIFACSLYSIWDWLSSKESLLELVNRQAIVTLQRDSNTCLSNVTVQQICI